MANMHPMIQKNLDCVESFKSSCADQAMHQFIDLFIDQYKSAHCHNKLDVTVCRGDANHFIPLLSSSVCDFKTVFGCLDNHPRMTIRASGYTHTIQGMDLCQIHGMHIDTVDQPHSPFVRHDISFNYMDMVDYRMTLFVYH